MKPLKTVLALTAVGLGLAWWPLALIVIPVLVWLFSFFRDPERRFPTEQHAMVSPADGSVSDITVKLALRDGEHVRETRLGTSEDKLAVQEKDGAVQVVVPRLVDHEIVVFELD